MPNMHSKSHGKTQNAVLNTIMLAYHHCVGGQLINAEAWDHICYHMLRILNVILVACYHIRACPRSYFSLC